MRQALAHATDKSQIIQVSWLGTGHAGLSLVTPAHGDFYASDIEDYAFDIDEANRLLDDAGYEDTDGDGIRECLADQDCDDLTFRLNYPDDSDTAPREAEQLQDTWTQVGVAVQIQGFEPDALTALCCPTFDFDVIIWSWYTDIDAGGLLVVATCDEIAVRVQRDGVLQPRVRRALRRRRQSSSTRRRAIEQIHELQQMRGRRGLHRPVLLPVDPGMADGHVHRLDRGEPNARARGSRPARPSSDRPNSANRRRAAGGRARRWASEAGICFARWAGRWSRSCVVITLNFVLFRILPGDPAKAGVRDPRLNEAAIEELRVRFGLDKPVLINLEGGNPVDTQFTAYIAALMSRRPRLVVRLP